MAGMQIFMCYVGEINGSNTLHYLLLNTEISKISFNQLLVLYDLFCFGLLFVQKYSSCCVSHIACRIRSKLLVRHSKAFQDLIPIGLFLSITQNTLCRAKQGSPHSVTMPRALLPSRSSFLLGCSPFIINVKSSQCQNQDQGSGFPCCLCFLEFRDRKRGRDMQ